MPFSLFALAVLAKDRHRISGSLTNVWQSRKNEYVLWQLLIEFSSVLKTNRTTLQLPNFPILAYSPFRAVFGKPLFVILNQNREAFIRTVCFSFVIFNAESICSPARLFDKKKKAIWVLRNSVNKAPRFRFGKQLLYIYSVRNLLLKLDCLQNLIHCLRNNMHSEDYE